jgi:DNA-binding Lrp family transcriptional regulator
MATAYILIKTTPGHERDVYYKFFHVPEVCEAHPLVGGYSLIIKIRAETFEQLGYITADIIGSVENIVSTEILPVLDISVKKPRLEEHLKTII